MVDQGNGLSHQEHITSDFLVGEKKEVKLRENSTNLYFLICAWLVESWGWREILLGVIWSQMSIRLGKIFTQELSGV